MLSPVQLFRALMVCFCIALFGSLVYGGPFCNTGEYFPGGTLAVGDSPRELASGDIDGDGDFDLVVANSASNSVTVLLNNGGGRFDTQIEVAPLGAFASPEGITLGDMDADGDLDLAVANFNSNSVSIFLNDGSGSFVYQGNLLVGQNPKDVVIGLIDGDLYGDLVVANSLDDTVGVFLHNGDATFTDAGSFAGGDVAQRLGLGDMDSDGDLDVVVVGDRTVKILKNDGAGVLTESLSETIDVGPRDLAIGDVDGDGDLDIVVANRLGTNATLLLNFGDGTLQGGGQNITVGAEHRSVALKDADQDGDLDLFVGDSTNGLLRVLINAGDGSYAGPELYFAGSNPWSIQAEDFDGDGVLDIAMSNRNSNDVRIVMGAGDGSFVDQVVLDSGAGSVPMYVDVGDVEGDGDLDFVVAHSAADGGNRKVQLFMNDGAGNFSPGLSFNGGAQPQSVHFVDLTAVVGLDIAVTSGNDNRLTVFFNTGDGSFNTVRTETTGVGPIHLAAAELNGNGLVDLVTANTNGGSVSVFVNNGDTNFTKSEFAVGTNPFGVALGDIDGVGGNDLAVALISEHKVKVYFNSRSSDESPVFSSDNVVEYSVGINPRGIVLGDFDGDEDLDLAVTSVGANNNEVAILLNNGSGAFALHEDGVVPLGSAPNHIDTADVDADGDLDLAITELQEDRVRILVNDGTGSFSVAQTLVVGNGPRGVAFGDFDGDLMADLVVGNSGDDDVSLFMNNYRAIAYWTGGVGSSFVEPLNWLGGLSPLLGAHNFVVFDRSVGGFGPNEFVNVGGNQVLGAMGLASQNILLNLEGNTLELLGDPLGSSVSLVLGIGQCGLGDLFPGAAPILTLVNTSGALATLVTPSVTVGYSGPAVLEMPFPSESLFLQIGHSLVVGANANGELSINGATKTLEYGEPNGGGDIFVVGQSAAGIVEVAGGALVNPDLLVDPSNDGVDTFVLGQNPGSMGTVRITGAGSLWEHKGNSFVVGKEGGAVLEIMDGGLLQTDSDNISLALESGSSAEVRISGQGSRWDDTAGAINMGVQGQAIFEVTNKGVLNIFGLTNQQFGTIVGNSIIDATLVNYGDLRVGDPAWATPLVAETLTIDNGGLRQFDDPVNPQYSGRLLLDIVDEGNGVISSDQVVVNGNALLGGSLIVSAQAGLDLNVGLRLVLLTSATPIGSNRFDIALLPGLPGGKYFQIEYDSSAVVTPTMQGSVSLVVASLSENTLNAPSGFTVGGVPSSAAIGDLNGDGFDDLALTVPDQNDPVGADGQLVILWNAQTTQSAGNWPGLTGGTLSLPTLPNPTDVAIGDLDQLHGGDLAVSSGTTGNVQIFLNDSTAPFTSPQSIAFNEAPESVGIFDLDADGFPDVVAAGSQPGGGVGVVTVGLNRGVSGSGWDGLDPILQEFAVGVRPMDIEVADLDGQNGMDLVTANFGSDSLSVLENLGTDVNGWLGFGGSSTIEVGGGPRMVLARGLDDEKDLDLFVINGDGGSMSIVLQNNPGASSLAEAFGPSGSLPVGDAGDTPLSVAFWDSDNDGDLDPAIVVSDSDGNRVVRLYRNLSVENVSSGNPGLSFVFDRDIQDGNEPLLIRSGRLNADEGLDLAIVGPEIGTGGSGFTNQAGGSDSNGFVYFDPGCPVDFNGDGVINVVDVSAFVAAFGSNDPSADFNGDGIINFVDVSAFVAAFGAGCP